MNSWLQQAIRGLLLLMLSVGGSLRLDAQTDYPVHYLGPKQGLHQTINSFLYQDRQGFIWISSIDGLCRYNGRSVQVFKPDGHNPHSIKGANIQSSFFEDGSGQIWFTTEEAINCFSPQTGRFRHFLIRDTAISDTNSVRYYIAALEQGRYLYVLVSKTLFRLDTQSPSASPVLVAPDFPAMRCVADTFSTGKLKCIWGINYWGKEQRIMALRFAENGSITQQTQYAVPLIQGGSTDIFYISSNHKGGVWLATKLGLLLFEPESAHPTHHYPNPFEKSQALNALATLPNGTLVMVYKSGNFYTFDGTDQRFQRLIGAAEYGSTTERTSQLTEVILEKDGFLWWSVRGEGVYFKRYDVHLPFYTPVQNSVAQPVLTIFEQDKRNIWLFAKRGRQTVRRPPFNTSPLVDQHLGYAKAIRDIHKNTWAFALDGLYEYKPERDEWILRKSSEIGGAYLDVVASTQKNTIFVGGLGVLCTIDLSTLQETQHSSENVYSLFCDRQGQLWQGGDHYLQVRAATLPHNVLCRLNCAGDVTCFWQDTRTSDIWVGTSKGLLRIDAISFEKKTEITEAEGLPNHYIYGIVQDRTGYLWLSTNVGIVRFMPGPGAYTFSQFTTNDGLLSNEFNPNAALLDSEGRIWLGNKKGIDVFHPDSIKNNGEAPKLAILGLKIHDNEWVTDSSINAVSHIDLPYNQNTLRLELAALEYLNPLLNQYRVSLSRVGEPENWVNLGTQYFVTYANLIPGEYIFQFVSANAEGIWTETTLAKKLTIVIHPHWSNTWWFRLLLASAILLLVSVVTSFYYRYRLYVQQLTIEKQQREAERQRLDLAIAESERKATESEIKLLRSQLNPHFLFNVMNSINRYILSSEPVKASEYLGQFARLIRKILDNSRSISISLADELGMLRHYIELESYRFEQKITWQIEIDPDLDEDDITVPSMFLQPFVENAILHGLAPKGGGQIDIVISRSGNNLEIVVQDNGVGRTFSPFPKDIKLPRHTSVGMQLISDRLRAFAHLENGVANVEITDLKDAFEQPAGTRVHISIPFKSSY